jgi:hypothetical protein
MAFNFTETSNSGPINVFRGEVDLAGNPVFVTLTQEERAKTFKVPPSAEYVLKVTGFTEPYVDTQYSEEGKPRKITDLELEIAEGRGQGARFFWRYQTFSLGGGDNPANLLRIYRAGGCDEKNKLFDNLIGVTFVAYVTASQATDDQGRPRYAKVSKDTIRPYQPNANAAYDPFNDNQVA